MFSILFSDDHFVAINKPPAMLVHRTPMSEDTVFVLQLLRDQLGHRIYPVHRLDRATSGVLIFGKTPEAASLLGVQLMHKALEKKYIAIVRGHIAERDTIDYPLADEETGQGLLAAVSHYRRLGLSTIEAAIGLRYSTARFSLVEVQPETGRRHQIRKHLAHLRHPVIGDVRHGDNKHNNYFRDVFGVNRLMLHAASLGFVHPVQGDAVRLVAPLDDDFLKGLEITELGSFLPG